MNFPGMRILGIFLMLFLCVLPCGAGGSEGRVTGVRAQPRYPWEGVVDIYYTVECTDTTAEIAISFRGHDRARGNVIAFRQEHLSGDGVDAPVIVGQEMHAVWDASAALPDFRSTAFTVEVVASCELGEWGDDYLVVDLSKGPDAASYPIRYSAEAPDVTNDTCRTTELWLRRIPAGSFAMGSPEDEIGRYADEALHQVTLTQDYYIGVFECTQKQYELVMGKNPSRYLGDTRPVECVSYDDLRGTGSAAGAGWPDAGYTVDDDSFLGRLQARTGLLLDLPTEAQWEYACRRKADGTICSTAVHSGTSLSNVTTCSNLATVARYYGNSASTTSDEKGGFSQHTRVGSYLPNSLGLYDMQGNVWEWCLDWYGYTLADATDPTGAASGTWRTTRGGSWAFCARCCRIANRRSNSAPDEQFHDLGFRLTCIGER
jgi:formylglycine-generating enzyme required for sulfatase activity